ncbi:MAG: hypothetical protein IPK50_00535 [Fibrobacterota bacterium]|nr:MAG: hypothetical protein IPK50_00535 [Fibrobacterota bacterium]
MKLLDPAFFRRSLAFGLLAGSLAFASGEGSDRLLWILSRIDSLPAPGSGSISHCAEMEKVQRTLLARRDSIATLRIAGRDRQAICKGLPSSPDAPCERALQSLRDSVGSLGLRESASRERLRQESSQCPAESWSLWLRYRTLDSSVTATPGPDSLEHRSQRIQKLTELGWTGNLEELIHSPTASSGLAPRVLEELANPAATCRWRLRHAFLLQRIGNPDSARKVLGSILSPGRCTLEAALAHHWLGTDSSLGDSLRASHLRLSLQRPDLRARSLLELAPLLAADSLWSAAFDTLATALRSDPSLLEPHHTDSLANWSDRAGIDPLSRLAVPPPAWLDRLLITRCRLLLASGRGRLAQTLLADFRLRFPRSSLGEEARELLARCRR